MPTLPTFTVSDATAQRILKTFQDHVDENGVALTPTQAYKRWLRGNLIGHVQREEAIVKVDPLETELA